MKYLPITYNIEGIKCDAKGCTWRDDSINWRDYDAWLNRSCPICGANLLTEADLNRTKQIRKFVLIFNIAFCWLIPVIVLAQLLFGESWRTVFFDVQMRGDGSVEIEETDEEEKPK